MAEMLTCPQGHRWSGHAEGLDSAGDQQRLCPICGAPSSKLPAGAEPATISLPATAPAAAESAASATISFQKPVALTRRPDATIEPSASAESATVTVQSPASPLFTKRMADETLEPLGALAGPVLEGKPRVAGGYEIFGELGRGGMGVVYKARQVRLNRVVALKMILAGAHAGPSEMARFRVEAEAAARLQHPNIVQIFEVGEQDGLPYFSLEFVDGGSLAQKTKATPQPATYAARVVETIARAVHHAHQHGIIHRDLKPANILLTAEGEPKITDFGLAKFLNGKEGQTRSGVVTGTPSYMSPEQASGRSKLAGPATDVYALGAILYALLTGRPPFHADSTVNTLQQVLSEEPVPPTQLSSKVPLDLETICLKCLQKEPHKRFATALDLAEDLRRFQAGEAIRARPIGLAEKGWKWARRRPAVAALIAVSIAAFLALLAGGLLHSVQLQEEVDRTERQRQRAVEQQGIAENERAVAEDRELRARQFWYVADLNLAQQAWEQTHIARVNELLERHRPEPGQADLRGFEWYYLWRQCHRDRLTLRGHLDAVWSVAFSPDGRSLASGDEHGTVKLWDPATGRERGTFRARCAQLSSVVFSPDSKTLAVASADGLVELWDVTTLKPQVPLRRKGAILFAAFAPDGKTLASANADNTVTLWDLATHQARTTLSAHTDRVTSVAFAPDGKTLASASHDRTIKLWELSTSQARATLNGHTGWVTCVAFAGNGKMLASGSQDNTVRLWDLPAGRPSATLLGHSEMITAVAFTQNGARLASVGWDKTMRVWDVGAAGAPGVLAPRSIWKGHTGLIWSVAFSPDGKLLATGSADRTVKIWDGVNGPERPLLKAHEQAVWSLAFSPDGKTLATASVDGTAKLWDVATQGERGVLTPRSTLKGHQKQICCVLFAPDGRTLATAGADNTVILWDVGAAGNRGVLAPQSTLKGHTSLVTSLAFSPDSQTLASGSLDTTVKLWDLPKAGERAVLAPRLTLPGHGLGVQCLAFAPDGKTLACGSEDRIVRLWDVANGVRQPPEEGEQKVLAPRATLQGHMAGVYSLAFSADGRTLASASDDKTIKLWDLATADGQGVLAPRSSLDGHADAVRSLVFAPDGKALTSASWDSTVKLWDLTTLQERATFKGSSQLVWALAFTPNGRTLAAGNGDGTVQFWEAAADQEAALPDQ